LFLEPIIRYTLPPTLTNTRSTPSCKRPIAASTREESIKIFPIWTKSERILDIGPVGVAGIRRITLFARSERTLDRFFDTSAFVKNAPYTYGNAGRTRNLQFGLKVVSKRHYHEYFTKNLSI
jgi:hypothetical protein